MARTTWSAITQYTIIPIEIVSCQTPIRQLANFEATLARSLDLVSLQDRPVLALNPRRALYGRTHCSGIRNGDGCGSRRLEPAERGNSLVCDPPICRQRGRPASE